MPVDFLNDESVAASAGSGAFPVPTLSAKWDLERLSGFLHLAEHSA
jgi:hypothetical protein